MWNDVYKSFAGFGIRLLALLIDLCVFIPVFLLFWAIERFGGIDLPFIVSILFVLYRIIFHFKRGATIGKAQTELRVEKYNGEKITFFQSLLHESVFIISLIITIVLSQIPSSVLTKTYESGSGAISFTRSVSDWQFYLSLIGILIIIIDVVWILMNKNKQALHDLVAQTYCKKN